MPGTIAVAAAVVIGVLTIYFFQGFLFGSKVATESPDDTEKAEENFVQRMASQVGVR